MPSATAALLFIFSRFNLPYGALRASSPLPALLPTPRPLPRVRPTPQPTQTGARTVPGSVRFLVPSDSRVQGYAAMMPPKWGSRCIVAFRGSVNLDNVEADIEFFKDDWPSQKWAAATKPTRTCPGCEVHSGFAGTYSGLRNELLQALDSLECTAVTFTGHSLGAAVATLAAMDARMRGVNVPLVYTYGSPRVGNKAFVNAFGAVARAMGYHPPSWRIVHHHDTVPHLPIALWAFHHVDREVWYTEADSSKSGASFEHRVCRSGGEDPKCSLQVMNMWPPDHTWYLGQSFRLKDMPQTCTG